MSGSLNKVMIIGNLGRDPESRTMTNGEQVTNLSIATSEVWKDRMTGEKRESTEWHRVVCFRRLAEIAAQYLRKGSKIYIEGKIKTRKWQNRDGVDQYTTEVHAEELTMLDRKGENHSAHEVYNKMPSQREPVTNDRPNISSNNQSFEEIDEDIPF